jgi:hypothetical protein
MKAVMSHLIETERQLAATRATDLAGLRAKAEVVIMAHRDDTSALALSLAKDVSQSSAAASCWYEAQREA